MHRYGHRGGVPELGENTLESIEEAAYQGYDGVELDVSRAGDGTLVLCHDRTVAMGGAEVPVDSIPADQLPGAPPLRQAIPLLQKTGLRVNLDLKIRDPFDLALATDALALLEPLQGRCLVSSFEPRLLRYAASVAPQVPRGLAWAPDLPAWLRNPALWIWSRATGLHARQDAIDHALVGRARRCGLAITAWNVKGTSRLDRLQDMGVHAVIGEGIRRRDPTPG